MANSHRYIWNLGLCYLIVFQVCNVKNYSSKMKEDTTKFYQGTRSNQPLWPQAHNHGHRKGESK